MIAEFEEKQFEMLLNMELAQDQALLYVPGQCFENFIGFDAAVNTRHRFFWSLFGSSPRGLILDPLLWDILDDEISHRFPSVKFNVFIQYKRPQYLISSRTKQWHNWLKPYYRIDITKHQQEILNKLSFQINGKGLVVYASPVFHKFNDLWNFNSQHRLTENTNFCECHKLNSHRHYTYSEPGNQGKAHSEAKDIESVIFSKTLMHLRENSDRRKTKSMLIETANLLSDLLNENAFYSGFRKQLLNDMKYYNDTPKIIRALIDIKVFQFLIGTTVSFGQ